MFLQVKSDSGAVAPWEYMEAAAGDYRAGQLLKVNDGRLTAIAADETGVPPYLAMADRTVKTAGEVLPVVRVGTDRIYETELEGAAETAAVGGRLQIAAGGLAAKAGAGAFEIVALEGTEKGCRVRGRWAAAAGA